MISENILNPFMCLSIKRSWEGTYLRLGAVLELDPGQTQGWALGPLCSRCRERCCRISPPALPSSHECECHMWIPANGETALKGLAQNFWSSLNPTKMQINTMVLTLGRGGREGKVKTTPPWQITKTCTLPNPPKQFRQTHPVSTKEVRGINFKASLKRFQI